MPESEQDRKIAQLRPRLTPEFIALLTETAKCYGWNGDYYEVADFIRWVHEEAGLPVPEQAALEPYAYAERPDV